MSAALDTDAALRALADRAAIRDVLLRYARGVDRRDWPLVAACFTPGAAADYGYVAQGTIEEAIAAIAPALEKLTSTMHVIGNQLIEIDGDTARSETYAVCYHRSGGLAAGALMTVGVRYLDELVRRDGRWLICRRVVTFEWQQRP